MIQTMDKNLSFEEELHEIYEHLKESIPSNHLLFDDVRSIISHMWKHFQIVLKNEVSKKIKLKGNFMFTNLLKLLSQTFAVLYRYTYCNTKLLLKKWSLFLFHA